MTKNPPVLTTEGFFLSTDIFAKDNSAAVHGDLAVFGGDLIADA